MLTANETQQKLSSIGYGKVFKVVFMKVDGTEREMKCYMEQPTTERKNSNAVPVVDIEKEAWRSFKLDSVVSITV